MGCKQSKPHNNVCNSRTPAVIAEEYKQITELLDGVKEGSKQYKFYQDALTVLNTELHSLNYEQVRARRCSCCC
eukprot:scaffold86108_cov78-Cyclotella_meneghiniana.AAC.2